MTSSSRACRTVSCAARQPASLLLGVLTHAGAADCTAAGVACAVSGVGGVEVASESHRTLAVGTNSSPRVASAWYIVLMACVAWLLLTLLLVLHVVLVSGCCRCWVGELMLLLLLGLVT